MNMLWSIDSSRGIVNNRRLPNIELLISSLSESKDRIANSTLENISDFIVPLIRNYQTAIICLSASYSAELFTLTQKMIKVIVDVDNKFDLANKRKFNCNDCLDKTNEQCNECQEKQMYTVRQTIGELKALANVLNCITMPLYLESRLDLNRKIESTYRSLDAFLELFKDTNVPYIHSFLGDYSRISFSSAFRRLQDKAQVFPLEKYDYARTRLTHTIEVSGIASQLGNLCALKLYQRDDKNKKRMAFLFEKCLMCAALLHDMGNPPFGHFGEDAIRDYFQTNWNKLSVIQFGINENGKWIETGSQNLYDLFQSEQTENEDMKNDLFCFDGNAQSLRLATKAQLYKVGHSLELTAGVLGSIIKYPCSSTQGRKKKKFGYFYSEKNIVDQLHSMGTYNENFRNPLSLLLEAADDISYVTSDLDDAIKKGVLTFADFESALDSINDESSIILREFKSNFILFFNKNKNAGVISPFEYTIQRMTTDLRNDLMRQVVNAFCENISTILLGTYYLSITDIEDNHDLYTYHLLDGNNELLKCVPARDLVEWIKNLFVKFVYDHECILKAELSGYEITKCLLEQFTEAVLSLNFEKDDSGNFILATKDHIKHKKVFNLISKNFVDAFKKETEHCADPNSPEHIYYRMRLVVDHVSGMTDCYAKEMYQILKGV